MQGDEDDARLGGGHPVTRSGHWSFVENGDAAPGGSLAADPRCTGRARPDKERSKWGLLCAATCCTGLPPSATC